MQLIHQNKAKWNDEEKNMSLSLYYKSPSAYKFLRDRGFKLPCITLIQRWVNIHNIKPGFSNEVFDKVKLKAATMSQEEKECVLMCDEMSIRKCFEYNPKLDLVEGYQDLGPLGRSEEVATHALVFMLRGLKSSWKCPIAYVVSKNSVKTSSLAILIDLCFEKIFDTALSLKAIVTDQGSNNAAAVRLMGVTKETPYIMFDTHKIYCLFDLPHLLKSVRNNLLKHDFCVNGEIISWSAIREFYELDKSSKTDCRAAPKLSERHLNPQAFQKMSVKLATQVFSGSVSRGMKAADSLGLLKHPASLSTANFLGKMNDVTDCMNSKNLNDSNPLKKPMCIRNLKTKQCLEENVSFVQSWSIKGHPNPPCFNGLLQTIEGVLQLYVDVVTDKSSFLLTSRLNQDPIENLFGVLRRRSGNNTNPSAKEFRRNLQHSLSIRLMKPPDSANCEPDEDENLCIVENLFTHGPSDGENTSSKDRETARQLVQDPPTQTESIQPSSTSEAEHALQPLEDNVICYIAGWLGKKTVDKYSCEKCLNDLLKQDNAMNLKRENLITFKAFIRHDGELAHLNKPSDVFHQVVNVQTLAFAECFPTVCSESDVRHKLTQYLVMKTEEVHLDWFSSECKPHRMFMLNLLVKCKLYYSFKWKTNEIRDRALLQQFKRGATNQSKLNPKLKKLKNV